MKTEHVDSAHTTNANRISEALVLSSMAAAILLGWSGIWRSVLPFDFFSILTVLLGGIPIYRETFHSLKGKKTNMEVSMAIGAVAALFIGQFLPAAVIIFFTRLAEFIESYIIDRGRRAIALLLERRPRKATVRRDGKEMEIVPDEVRPTDTVLVKPGGTIAVDGVVLGGTSLVNQAAMTGESVPVEKYPGQEVFAGTLNETGLLEVQPKRIGEDTTFERIVRLIEEAEKTKPRIEKVSDRLAGWLVYSALGSAILTFLVTGNATSAISVIVTAGACGVAAGTPLAILAGIGRGARRGVIIKGGVFLEALRKIDTVVLDKTGTLTYGEPKVANVIAINSYSRERVLQLASVAERYSSHPIARAILREVGESGITLPHHSEFEYFPGKGVLCTYDGGLIGVGSESFLDDRGVIIPQVVRERVAEESRSESTPVLVAHDQEVCGIISVATSPRKEAKDAVRELKSMGIRTIMLTGDRLRIAEETAQQLGIDEIHAEMLPDDKVFKVREILREGHVVAMVGDGTNDAPALAQATVGIAMGEGTDIALETADIALISNDLRKIVDAINISRGTYGVIMQNFAGTLLVDTIGMALAFVGMLSPLLAAFIHTFSEFVFMLNSSRLFRAA